jgi:hypothetical protein
MYIQKEAHLIIRLAFKIIAKTHLLMAIQSNRTTSSIISHFLAKTNVSKQ